MRLKEDSCKVKEQQKKRGFDKHENIYLRI